MDGAGKQRLLLVDPDAKSARVLEVSLKKAGFQVTTATGADEALASLQSEPADLVISDTVMTGMDGFELCRQLKARPDWARVPFIFLASSKSLEDKIRGLELGVEDYLTKPIYIKEIITRVRMLLQRQQREHLESVRRDSRTKFAGHLADVSLVDLAQTIEINRKSGVVHLANRDRRRGEVYFRQGVIIDAEVGRLQGADALYRLFSWSDGEFEVEFKNIRRKDAIELSTQAVLMEGMRRLDEWTHILDTLPPIDTIFEVDYRLLADRLADLPDEVNGVLRLFDGRRTLMQVIDDCDIPDLEALSIIGKLYTDEIIYDTEREAEATEDLEEEGEEGTPELEGWLSQSSGAVASFPSAAPAREAARAGAPAKAAPIEPAPALAPLPPGTPDVRMGLPRSESLAPVAPVAVAAKPATTLPSLAGRVPSAEPTKVEPAQPAPVPAGPGPTASRPETVAPSAAAAVLPSPAVVQPSPASWPSAPPIAAVPPVAQAAGRDEFSESAAEWEELTTTPADAAARARSPEGNVIQFPAQSPRGTVRTSAGTPPVPMAAVSGEVGAAPPRPETREPERPAPEPRHVEPSLPAPPEAVASSPLAASQATAVAGTPEPPPPVAPPVGVAPLAAAAASGPVEPPPMAAAPPPPEGAVPASEMGLGAEAAARPVTGSIVTPPSPSFETAEFVVPTRRPMWLFILIGFAAAVGIAYLFLPSGKSPPAQQVAAVAPPPPAPPAPPGLPGSPSLQPAAAASPEPSPAPGGEASPAPAPAAASPEPTAVAATAPSPSPSPEPTAAGGAATAEVKPAGGPGATAAEEEAPATFEALLKDCKRAYKRARGSAVAVCSKALEKKPDAAEPMVILANVEIDRGKLASALTWAQKATQADPTFADGWLVLGTVMQGKGQKGDAKAAYRKYLELSPKGHYADDVRAILGTL